MKKAVVQLCLTVPNLAESLKFYRDTLGMEQVVAPFGPLVGQELSDSVGVADASLSLAFLRYGDTLIELTEYQAPVATGLTTPVSYMATGAIIPGFAVEDLEATYAKLKAAGERFVSEINLVSPDSIELMGARKWVRLYTPEGGQVELVEPA